MGAKNDVSLGCFCFFGCGDAVSSFNESKGWTLRQKRISFYLESPLFATQVVGRATPR